MGMNMILTLIAGIVMTTMIGSTIAPSIIEGTKVTKVQTQTINNQEVIFEAIKRYTTIKQVAPTSIQDLIDAGYLEANVNDNGFGEEYTINVDKALGVATITTTIEDPKVQEAFLNSFMGTSKPTRVGATNDFETKFVLPNEVMHGNALLMTGIPIQATPPDSNTNKYWYDTSSGKAILKIFDGTNWVEVNLGGSGDSIPIQNTPPDPTKYSYWYDSSVVGKLTLKAFVGGIWEKVQEDSGSTPSGSIITFAGTTTPDGYLLCNGQEVSRTTYSDLFAAIGTTYGSTSGTTFKVPDLRGEFIRGFDAGRGIDSGRIFGSFQVDEFKTHEHKMQGSTYGYDTNKYGVYSASNYAVVTKVLRQKGTTIENGGGVETRPRNIAMNYIIKY